MFTVLQSARVTFWRCRLDIELDSATVFPLCREGPRSPCGSEASLAGIRARKGRACRPVFHTVAVQRRTRTGLPHFKSGLWCVPSQKKEEGRASGDSDASSGRIAYEAGRDSYSRRVASAPAARYTPAGPNAASPGGRPRFRNRGKSGNGRRFSEQRPSPARSRHGFSPVAHLNQGPFGGHVSLLPRQG